MTCMSCGLTKAWPVAFPAGTIYATCWECVWKQHLREQHPKSVRKARKEAERRAKLRFRNEAHQAVEKELISRSILPEMQAKGTEL